MSDFNPVTLYFILSEAMGLWLWLLIAAVVAGLAGVVSGAIALRRARRPLRRPLTAGIVVTALATIALLFLVPLWTRADIGSLGTAVDYLFAVLLALVPASILGMAVFSLAARRCAGRAA